MKKNEFRKLFQGTVLVNKDHESEESFDTVFCCDMMSELLSVMNDKGRDNSGVVLLTNLTNPQVIRASEMVDIQFVIFLRGRRPEQETIETASRCGITLMSTPFTVFKCCGILYGTDMRDFEDA